ncbi:transposase, partial [Streptomyces sp. H27-D2]
MLAELCTELFASLPRSDQRRRGTDYVRGLLDTRGRKSIRNIAAFLGDPALEQSLHHFVTSSTWGWTPVRQVLARYVARVAPPQAWVVRPMVIPKAGENTVGVDKRFFPAFGQVLNAQQAVGVWAASPRLSVPVNWRLQLSRGWLDDGERRSRASIPDGVESQTPEDFALGACLDSALHWDLPVRPVVMEAGEADACAIARKLRAAGLPLLIKVGSTLPVSVADPALPGHGGAVPLPA